MLLGGADAGEAYYTGMVPEEYLPGFAPPTHPTTRDTVRLKEFLAMKTKEVGDRYMDILQKQRMEFESLMAQNLREQEDSIA